MENNKRPWDIKGNTKPITKEEFDKWCGQYIEYNNKPRQWLIYTGEKNFPILKKLFGL